MIICQHDQLKRQCPLCDLEDENAALKQEIRDLKDVISSSKLLDEEVGAAVREVQDRQDAEIEQLKADKATLLEYVEWAENAEGPPSLFNIKASDCLAELGGTNHD